MSSGHARESDWKIYDNSCNQPFQSKVDLLSLILSCPAAHFKYYNSSLIIIAIDIYTS